MTKHLLVAGPDGSLRDVFALASEAYPGRKVELLHIPSRDYYYFDLEPLAAYPANEWDLCLAVNEFYINDVRRALHERVVSLGYQCVSAISPRAHVDASVALGDNVVIHAGSFVGAGGQIGDLVVLRPNVVLAEEVAVGSYVTLEANVAVREKSKIGNFTTVCANSSLARGTRVGAHCYLNLPQQYSGDIIACTFYSPAFENPVRVLEPAPA